MNEALLAEYINSLRKRIERLDSLMEKFAEGNPRADENIKLLAHSLHGSGASFGFPEISEAGKAVEHAEPDQMKENLITLKKVLEKVVADNAGSPASASAAPAAVSPPRKEHKQPASTAGNIQQETASEDSPLLRILVVEDDPDMAALITGILGTLPKKQDFKVVNTGAKAQAAIVKNVYDLIVMDLVLPDRDGRELIQEIKLEFRLATPLLVLSSIHNDAVRVECMSFGADKYLTKPFFDEDLIREAKKLLGKKIKRQLTLVPLDGEAQPEEEDNDTGPGPLQMQNILLAEDDKMQAKLIHQRLTKEGATVKEAGNGREAMQFLRSQEFSMAILDVKMPVMDGFEVLERIRGELKLDIPVIMVTAMGSENDIIRGYELGATDYILKPFSEVQLVARVKSLLK
jgi:DNA-binding response OmpR family regulator